MASPLHVVGQLCSAGPGWVCHLITRFDTKGALNGRDMREQCLLQRKRRLRRVVPTASGCLLYAITLSALAAISSHSRGNDLEGNRREGPRPARLVRTLG
jgi:hypothetical protein